METRSRKRAEATSHRPSPARPSRSKRARLSASSSAAAASAPIPPRPRPPTRTSIAAAAAAAAARSLEAAPMDPAYDALALASKRESDKASRRESEKAAKRELEKAAKRDQEREEEQRAAEKENEKDRDTDKGKEKEAEKEKERARDRDRDRDRDRERERDRAAAAAAAAAVAGFADDDHDGEGGSTLHQNLASASSALHGLLRKLGAGLDDLMPSSTPSSHQNSRLKKILSGLRAEGEEGRQLDALSQLCELLSIGTEESLSSFSVDSFVPVLVGLLNCEYNPDMMLLAARALTHLCDVLPSSCAAVVHYGAVPCFCARLLTIEYIDLAEQSLQALEKISHEHPTACLRAGALIAVLSYLDFFSTGVQRVAVSTAANICRQLPSDASDFVMEAVPILTNLLQYQDSKVVEQASVCLTRIAEAFATSPEKLDTLCSHGLIAQTARLISVGSSSGSLIPQASLGNATYTGLIRLLSTCTSGSAAAAESLLDLRISRILKDILAGSGLVSSTSVSPSSVNRPPEQLYEVVTLINELLPPMPGVPGAATASTSNGGKSAKKHGKSEEGDVTVSEISPREKLLRCQPELLVQFGADLFPVLVQVYGSSVNPPVRHKCLAAINKLLHFSTADMLRTLLKESNISSFLSGVLASKDASVLITALQIAEMLMQKLPDVFTKVFVKEGVVHAIDLLIASEHSQGASQQSSASARGADASGASTVATSRPRRGAPGRRRGAALTDPADELGGSSSAPVGSPPTGGPEPAFRSARSGLRAAYISSAKRFKEQYFSGDSGLTDAGLTESLCKLKGLSAKLSGDAVVEVKGKGKGKGKASQAPSLSDEQLLGIIQEILVELGGGDGVSTFEFVGSGVVGSLLHFFSCGNLTKENITDPNSARLRQQALKRFKEFIGLALPMVDQGKEVPLTMLVQKLQNALASLERFPVVISHSPRSATSGASIAAGLSALAQPFKLRLCRAPGERVLRDYSSNVVLIEPLATFVAVEDFLWPRVKRHEAVSTSAANSVEAGDAVPATDSAPGTTPSTTAPVVSERRPSTRSRTAAVVASAAATASASASASVSGPAASASVTAGSRRNLEAAGSITSSKGKGKVCTKNTVETPSPEEHRGPETRNAAARRRASAAEASLLKQAEGASSMESEDEEVNASPVELEEAVAMEEDEISEDDEDEEEHEEDDDLDDDQADEEVFGEEPSPVCIGERVHDVQLGDGNDVGNLASSSVTGSEALLPASGFASGISGVNLGGRSNPVGAGAETSGLRTGSSVGAKGSLSFAAVAMAGGTSLGGSGGRGVARDRRTTMASLVAANLPPKLVFSLGGKPLNRSLTIFQAVQRQIVADDEDEERYAGTDAVGTGRRLWEEIYTITYQRADSSTTDQPAASSSGSGSQRLETNSQSRAVNAGSSCAEGSWQQASLLDSILQGELPCDLDKSNTTYNILLLLRVLEGLNRIAPRLRAQQAADAFAEGKVTKFEDIRGYGALVPREEFLSSKLTPKLARQMQDALALCSGGLPSWCHQLTRACPFLFPFETRRQYFHATAFGLSRALQRLQQQQTADGQAVSTDRELRVGRLQRQKVRVSRNRILDSAAKVMELYSGNKAVLEVEYFGEVGTGLGPTLEFYTLLSHELQKASLDLWRTDIVSSVEDDVEMQDAEGEPVAESPSAGSRGTADSLNIAGDYVQSSQGLFPRPWPSNMDTSNNRYAKVVEHFRLLGRVMAKALQDGRLLDLPLSTAFYKLVLGQDLDLYDVKSIDHELGKTLQELQVLVRRKQYLECTPGEKKHAISQLRFRGSRIEDLCLDFTLPGYPDYLLRPNGSEILVDVSNLEDYISLVVDATVKTGILPQMEAFRAGFNQVFQLSSLQIFSEDELDSLLCGRCELWTPDSLSDLIKFDHGYTASSPPIRNLLEIMGEFTAEEQRSFLRFVTGAPRLPPGGLSALSPKLTIVRKHPTGVSTVIPALGTTPPGPVSGLGTTLADGDLPSVMTCANYLKLPPYSSKEVMRERLLYAILEGQGSFDLS